MASAAHRSPNADPALLAGIFLAAAAVRLPMFWTSIGGLASPKILWYDEAYSVFFASRGLVDAIRLSGYDSTPGLFVALLSLWTKVFGGSTAALAAMSFVFSLLGVYLAYRLGRRLFGGRAGLLAAGLLALAPLHVKFATEIRVYSLLTCLAALSLLALWRFLEKQDGWSGAAWIAVSVLGLYGHVTFGVFLLLENIFLAERWRAGRFRAVRTWIYCLAAGTAACLPMLLIFRRWNDFFMQPGGSSFFSRAFGHGGAGALLSFFAALFFGERSYYSGSLIVAALSLLLGAAAAAGLGYVVYRRRRDDRVRLLGLMVFGAAVFFPLFGLVYDPRYYLIYIIPALVLAASALAELPVRRLLLAAAAAVLIMAAPVVGSWSVTPALAFKYYAPSFASALAAEERPGDLLLMDHFTDILFRRYYHGSARTAVFFPDRGRSVTDIYERFRLFDYDLMSAADLPTLERLTAGADRVWTVDYFPQRTSIQDPGGLKRRWLDGHLTLEKIWEFPPSDGGQQTTQLLLYARR